MKRIFLSLALLLGTIIALPAWLPQLGFQTTATTCILMAPSSIKGIRRGAVPPIDEEADRYPQNRADKGYNVIQAVALANVTARDNAYGTSLPTVTRHDLPPLREQNDYWDTWITSSRRPTFGPLHGFYHLGALLER